MQREAGKKKRVGKEGEEGRPIQPEEGWREANEKRNAKKRMMNRRMKKLFWINYKRPANVRHFFRLENY
jgi:hypothetical protein